MLNYTPPQVSISLPPPPAHAEIIVGGVDITRAVTAFSIDASAARNGGLPTIHLQLDPMVPVEFDGIADVHVHHPPTPLRDFLRNIDPKWLKRKVEMAGFVEHPVDTVLDVLLRLAEEAPHVEDDETGSGEAPESGR